MRQFSYTIQDSMGIHARPAGVIARMAREMDSDITIEKSGKSANARKLIALMGLNVLQGETVTVSVVGAQENDDCQKMEDFFQENL